MSDRYFYTCITHDETGEIRFAEHFEDEAQMRKRAMQLECEARSLGPWKCYMGEEPPEAFLVRLHAKPAESEVWAEGDSKETAKAKAEAYQARIDKEAAKAGSKTASVLTAPEIDDSEEARPLPPLALAISAVEAATQAVLDAKQGADALKLRADNLAEAAYTRAALSASEDVKVELRRKALSAQAEADYAAARLYHAEQDLAAKVQAVESLKLKEGKHA